MWQWMFSKPWVHSKNTDVCCFIIQTLMAPTPKGLIKEVQAMEVEFICTVGDSNMGSNVHTSTCSL